jgi:hypothetical protein
MLIVKVRAAILLVSAAAFIACDGGSDDSVTDTAIGGRAATSGKSDDSVTDTATGGRTATSGKSDDSATDTATGGRTATSGKSAGGSNASATASMDDYLSAAIVVGSCMPDDGIQRSLARFYEPKLSAGYFADFTAQSVCLASVGGGCNAVRDCLGYTAKLSSSCSAAPVRSCNNEVISVCEEGGLLTVDCGVNGYECADGYGCVQDAAATCEESTYTTSCTVDGRPRRCNGGYVEAGVPCADLGLACENDVCVGTGDACTGGYGDDETVTFLGLGCSGDKLTACVQGKTAVRDCASVGEGFTCQHYEDRYFCGLAAECDPGNSDGEAFEAYCDGHSVVLCNAGRIETVDCTSLGFTGCDLDRGFGCTPGILGD